MIEGIISGAIAGAAYGIVGYARNKPDNSTFDWSAFGVTVVGSAVVGGYANYSGLAIDIVASSAIGVMVTQTVKKLFDVAKAKIEEVMAKQ